MPPTAPKLDPVTLSLLNAPEDDEEETEEEHRMVEESRESLRRGEPTVSLEDLAREFGIKL